MADRAQRALNALDGPYLVYSFGGRNNANAEHVLERALADAVLTATRTAALAFDRASRVVERPPTAMAAAE